MQSFCSEWVLERRSLDQKRSSRFCSLGKQWARMTESTKTERSRQVWMSRNQRPGGQSLQGWLHEQLGKRLVLGQRWLAVCSTFAFPSRSRQTWKLRQITELEKTKGLHLTVALWRQTQRSSPSHADITRGYAVHTAPGLIPLQTNQWPTQSTLG